METAGHLVSSTDESFSVFKGIEGLPKDKKRIFKKTKSQETKAEFGGQKIILDTMWKQSMENLWLLEDFAILSMTTMSVPEEQKIMQWILFCAAFAKAQTCHIQLHRKEKLQ